MSCTNPNYALDLGMVDGKRKIKFLPKRYDLYSLHSLEARYGKEHILALPCGRCTSCLLNYSREWAVRCCLEASLYKNNYFVTLTYSDQNIPFNKDESRRNVQLFIKRLRFYHPYVKYFGCTEKGDRTKRLHHHLILFNLNLDDARPLGKGIVQGHYYKSKFLEKLWNKGIVDIGEVSFQSCSYVARYCMKKRFQEKDPDEYVFMSRNIGLDWFKQHQDTCIKYDKIFFNFGTFTKASLPRCFDKLIEKEHPEAFEQIKRQRIDSSNLSSISDLIRYGLVYREELYTLNSNNIDRKVKLLKRSL